MGTLIKPKHELFAQELAKGKTEVEAYEIAGYSPNDGNANKLASQQRIQDRVKEITGHAAERAEVTVESLLRELDDAAQLAKECKQTATLVAVVREKGILSGKRVERLETGRPGDFSKMSHDELADFIKARASRVGTGVPRVGVAAGSNGAGKLPH